jgi:drug/metabolite transporter (DMT)-like permease
MSGRVVPLALMSIAAASWAAATVLTKVVLDELTPLDVLGVELFSSAAVMVLVLVVRGRPFVPAVWPVFALLGVLEPALTFGLFDFGIAHTGAADGALLISSESLFGVVLARLLLGERASTLTRAAVVVGFAGSALVGLAATGHAMSLGGDLLVLAASATAAAYGVGARGFGGGVDTFAATTTQLVTAALVAAPFIVVAGAGGRSHVTHADAAHLGAAVATGLLGGAVPFLAFNRAIRDLTVAHAGLVLNLIPVLAAGGAVVALGEHLAWSELVGGGLVVGAATTASLPSAS